MHARSLLLANGDNDADDLFKDLCQRGARPLIHLRRTGSMLNAVYGNLSVWLPAPVW